MSIKGEDIVVTAVEGGINHWADITSYDSVYGRADIVDREEGTRHELDPRSVRRAMHRVLELYPRTDGAGYIRTAIRDDDPGMIDGEAADMIVQVAVFGEVVYG